MKDDYLGGANTLYLAFHEASTLCSPGFREQQDGVQGKKFLWGEEHGTRKRKTK